MTAARTGFAQYRPTTRQLRYVGAALAYLVAGVHLFHPERGFPRLVTLLSTGNTALLSSDPRPLLFVLSGVAILAGIKLVLLGLPRKPIYALGIALTATFFVGYFAWHLTGHGGFLPNRPPHYHGLSPVGAVVSHLQAYPLARISKVAEALLLAVLVVLYRTDT